MIVQALASTTLGGGELVGLDLAVAARRVGRDSEVWLPGGGAVADAARERGLDTQQVPFVKASVSNPLVSLCALGKVWSLARRVTGLVHVHSHFCFGTIARALDASCVKCIAHVHLETGADVFAWAFRKPPEIIVTCAGFLARKVENALADDVLAKTQVVAVRNAVDTDEFFPKDRLESKLAVGAPADRPMLLMLANLAPHKGQTTALRCVSELKSRGVEVECWLAGVQRDGDDFEQLLRSMAAELGIDDRVRFLGFRGDAPDLLRAADVLLLPSTNEGLPLTILEAQASGVPVVAAPTAGIPEVVEEGRTGFLVPADEAFGYASAVERLLESPQLRGEIVGAASRQIHEQHTWHSYSGRMMELYDEVLNQEYRNPPAPMCE